MKRPRPQIKHPQDPEYDDNYNYEEELYRYEMEIEAEEEQRRIDRYLNNNSNS